MMPIEQRFTEIEIRETDGGDGDGPLTFEGYASVFGGVDSYNDTIKKGAFRETLREWKKGGKLPKMLLQHGGGFFGGSAQDKSPIGAWTEMKEDDHGLFARGTLLDAQTPRLLETASAIRAGVLDGLSIGFRTKKSEMDEDTGIRTLTEIQLFEVSPVTFPADEAARVTGTKADEDLATEREFERFLRDVGGLSHRQARAVCERGYRSLIKASGEALRADEAAALVASLKRGATIFRGH